MKPSISFFTCIIICALSCQRYVYKDYNAEKAKRQYDESLIKTSDVTKETAFNNLLSIEQDSSNLTWSKFSGQAYLLVTMWKKTADTMYYKNDCTTGFYNTGKRYNFVTVVPQLKEACRKNRFGRRQGVSLRLEQVLGLPVGSDKTSFVEAWVKPSDLLRPCRDMDVNDRSCDRFPSDTTSLAYREYVHWLNTGNKGYPFTQLGYTYDWSHANKSHEGMSEFLIDKNSSIVIKDFVETCDYCYVKRIKKEKKK